MRKSGSRRKAEPSRRYIGIGVSHYKGVFHRIFKYSYSLQSGAIGVGEGGSRQRKLKYGSSMSIPCFFAVTGSGPHPVLLHNSGFCNGFITNRISIYMLSLHKKTNIIQKMSKTTKTIRLLNYFQVL